MLYFYPRHPRGWRPFRWTGPRRPFWISIHATLAGGDRKAKGDAKSIAISIHATLAGGDPVRRPPGLVPRTFLSTPPSRVATAVRLGAPNRLEISIHATLAGGDGRSRAERGTANNFYPRHPRGWRRPRRDALGAARYISIHATLAGGDRLAQGVVRPQHRNFYPRHPRGWRRSAVPMKPGQSKFLSTPPSRVATVQNRDLYL